jgi:hypothetical protein
MLATGAARAERGGMRARGLSVRLVFTNTVFSIKMSDPSACDILWRGATDYASEARVSADGKHCCIDRIVLRAEGVPASTTDL